MSSYHTPEHYKIKRSGKLSFSESAAKFEEEVNAVASRNKLPPYVRSKDQDTSIFS